MRVWTTTEQLTVCNPGNGPTITGTTSQAVSHCAALCSSPMTPPCQVSPAFPLTPPPAPLKQPRSQQLPPGYRQTAASLLGEPQACQVQSR